MSSELWTLHDNWDRHTEPLQGWRVPGNTQQLFPIDLWWENISEEYSPINEDLFGLSKYQPREQSMFLAGDFTDEQSLSVHSALGTNDHLRTLDTGQHNNNARSHEFYQVGVKEDGLYHCPYEGSTSTFCKHKPTILKCHYDKYVDAHLKPFRCEESHCDNLSFSSPACLNRHKRETHGRYIQCPAPGCNRKKENGFKRSLNLLDHINRVHIEGSRKDRHPPRKDRHPPRKDRHVPKKDRLRCPYSGCESNDFKSKKTLSAHIWKFHSTMDEDNFLKLPCPYSNCSCSSPGRGFLRCDNLSDHLRRIHNSPIW